MEEGENGTVGENYDDDVMTISRMVTILVVVSIAVANVAKIADGSKIEGKKDDGANGCHKK